MKEINRGYHILQEIEPWRLAIALSLFHSLSLSLSDEHVWVLLARGRGRQCVQNDREIHPSESTHPPYISKKWWKPCAAVVCLTLTELVMFTLRKAKMMEALRSGGVFNVDGTGDVHFLRKANLRKEINLVIKCEIVSIKNWEVRIDCICWCT